MFVSQFRLWADNEAEEETELVLLLTNLGAEIYYFGFTFHTQIDDFDDLAEGWAEGEYLYVPFYVEPAGSKKWAFDTLMPVLPDETVRVRLYPSDEAGDDGLVRYYGMTGHVELTLPTKTDYQYDQTSEPQGDQPVPVLLHAYTQDRRDGNVRDYHPLSITPSSGPIEITPDQTPMMKVESPKELLQIRSAIRSRRADLRIAMADPRIGPRLRPLLSKARDERDLRAIDALLARSRKAGAPTRGRKRGRSR